MEFCAIYCRLSDEDKDKASKGDDSESIQNQKLLLSEYAASQGWAVYRIYSDDDYSGLDQDRPAFNAMLRDAEAGRFHILLCKTQSRFTRDMELVEKYLHHKFIEWGIRFIGLVDHVDTSIKGNKKARQINGLINEWYCEDLSDNIRSVFRSKMRQGQYLGAYAPYGYQKDPSDNHRLVIDPEAAEVVQKIFSLYLQGYGTHRIAQILNDLGYPKPSVYRQILQKTCPAPNDDMDAGRSGLWSHTTINRILRNEVYTGVLCQGKETTISYKSKKRIWRDKSEWITIENNHEAIIDRRDFDAVQSLLDQKRRSGKPGKAHLFATLVHCMDCGGTMIKGTTNTNQLHNVTYQYLKCGTYTKSSGKYCPTPHRINFARLESAVIQELERLLNAYLDQEGYDRVCAKLCPTNSQDASRVRHDLSLVQQKKEERNRALSSLYIDKANGQIDEAQYAIISKGICRELEQLTRQEEELLVVSAKQENTEPVTLPHRLKISDLTYDIVHKAIRSIEIGDIHDGAQEVNIHWNFSRFF